MIPSKLSDHIFKKGKFTTPLNDIPNMTALADEKSWAYGRLPEYLWIALILNQHGRENGLRMVNEIITALHKAVPDLSTPRMSGILSLDETVQADFYRKISEVVSKETLAPLTLIFTVSKASEFSKWFYCLELTFEERQSRIIDTMQKTMGHQTNESTDIRFVVLCFNIWSGKMHIPKNEIDMLMRYSTLPHSDEEMRMIRPTVRSMEMMILETEKVNTDYLNDFWGCISEMTECTLFSKRFPQETKDIDKYIENLYEIFIYLSELYVGTNPLDEKMQVITGISTYSYKRFKEAYNHNLFNAISGRGCVRILIENYITLKYLIKIESSHENVWQEYQDYGIGLYKLVLARHRENPKREGSHFDTNYIEALINEFKTEESIDMDTRYFDKQGY